MKDDSDILCCCVVPDSAASALAVGPIRPIINQARSEPGLVRVSYQT